jgi:hypothetical protein
VEALGRFALLFFLDERRRPRDKAVEKRFERIADSAVLPVGGLGLEGSRTFIRTRCRTRGRRTAIVLFHHGVEYEPVPVARHRPDVNGIARVVAERSPQRPNGLAQRAVRDDDVVPDAIEDLLAMDGLRAALDEKYQQIEIARDQRQLAAAASENALRWREGELGKPESPQRSYDTANLLARGVEISENGYIATPAAGPTYSDAGRISRPTRPCSSTCAHQPATRDAANVGENSVRGMPIASSRTAV